MCAVQSLYADFSELLRCKAHLSAGCFIILFLFCFFSLFIFYYYLPVEGTPLGRLFYYFIFILFFSLFIYYGYLPVEGTPLGRLSFATLTCFM
jgi:hypothetical protein